MTPRAARLTIAAIITACFAVSWLGASRLVSAEAGAAAAVRTAAGVERDAARLEDLRAARPTVGQGAEPQADALSLINAAMSESNLPVTLLRSLAPEGGAQGAAGAPGAPGYQQRSLRLTIGAIALPDLGRFLQSWRTTQGVWTITQISLRREPTPRGQAQNLWTVTMTLSAMYVQSEPAGGTP